MERALYALLQWMRQRRDEYESMVARTRYWLQRRIFTITLPLNRSDLGLLPGGDTRNDVRKLTELVSEGRYRNGTAEAWRFYGPGC